LEWKSPRGDLRIAEGEVDLVTFKQSPDNWLGGVFRESILKFIYMEDLVRLKTDASGKEQAIVFFPSSKIEKIVTGTAVLLSVILTVLAIATLNYEKRDGARLGLVGLYTLLVAGLLTLSGASKSEVTMGTVGYAAILVVYVSSRNSG